MPPLLRKIFQFQESGLILVVLVLALLLSVFGGHVNRPVYQTMPDGTMQPVYVKDAQGKDTDTRMVTTENKFFNVQNLALLAKQTSFIAIMAVGIALVIISGGIDLSVGSIYALASVLGALTLHYFGPDMPGDGTSPWISVSLGMLVCVGAGALCGLINGGLVVALRVHPFIITLGMMSIFRGAAFVATKGISIGNFPPQLQAHINYEVGNHLTLVPLGVMILVTIAGTIFLSRLAIGRRIYAIGGNELASRFSGIRVEWVKLSVYVLAGLATGLAALLAIGCYGSASSNDGNGYELKAIAAAVVGGTSLSGGRGTALGATLGALIIQMIDDGIIILGIDQSYSQIIIGSVVILAVVLDKVNTSLAQRRLTRQQS
jgi:ribose transport system permease protein